MPRKSETPSSTKTYYPPRPFRLSDETMEMLGTMAQAHKRGRGKELEVIIEKAYKEFENERGAVEDV
jgi:hypothetical protein